MFHIYCANASTADSAATDSVAGGFILGDSFLGESMLGRFIVADSMLGERWRDSKSVSEEGFEVDSEREGKMVRDIFVPRDSKGGSNSSGETEVGDTKVNCLVRVNSPVRGDETGDGLDRMDGYCCLLLIDFLDSLDCFDFGGLMGWGLGPRLEARLRDAVVGDV